MDKIRVVIIDDEYLAREIIRTYLNSDDEIEVVGECENGFEGFKLINEVKPDLIFLDVMMPKLNGFELLELLDDPPVVIFSTAYDEYAIQAFEKNAIDYLLKPYSIARFNESITKVKMKFSTQTTVSTNTKLSDPEGHFQQEKLVRVAVKTGNRIQIISVDDINYIEAMDDYVKIHTSQGAFLKQKTMKFYESHLPPDDFVRIHRSYIVKIKAISKLELLGKDSHVVQLLGGNQLPVSRSGYSRLKQALKF